MCLQSDGDFYFTDLSSDREREGNANFGLGCVDGSPRYPPLTLTVACRVDHGIANDC